MLGLDLFPDYATYTAAGIPVIGMLPILPADNTANALFLTGGNATTIGAMAAVVQEHFGATKVEHRQRRQRRRQRQRGRRSPHRSTSPASPTSRSRAATTRPTPGIQGLMRQAADDDPDLLDLAVRRCRMHRHDPWPGITRHRDPGRLDSICADSRRDRRSRRRRPRLALRRDPTDEDTPSWRILQEILAPALGVAPEEVDSTALGLGGLGLTTTLSIAGYANQMAEAGGEVTGQGIYDFIGSHEGLTYWPGDTDIECGAAESYSAICAYTYPVATYDPSGEVLTVVGLEKVSSIPYLP